MAEANTRPTSGVRFSPAGRCAALKAPKSHYPAAAAADLPPHRAAGGKGRRRSRLCRALDITTTLAASLLNRATGRFCTRSCLNPQRSYGADVISRIVACKGKARRLCRLVRERVAEIIHAFSSEYPDKRHLCVAGNTTMLHIFCGISPRASDSSLPPALPSGATLTEPLWVAGVAGDGSPVGRPTSERYYRRGVCLAYVEAALRCLWT